MELLIFLLVLGIGLTAGYYFRRTIAKHDAKTAEAKVEKMISDAKDFGPSTGSPRSALQLARSAPAGTR